MKVFPANAIFKNVNLLPRKVTLISFVRSYLSKHLFDIVELMFCCSLDDLNYSILFFLLTSLRACINFAALIRR